MNGGQYHPFPANIPPTPRQPAPQQGSPANLWNNSTPQTADIQPSPIQPINRTLNTPQGAEIYGTHGTPTSSGSVSEIQRRCLKYKK